MAESIVKLVLGKVEVLLSKEAGLLLGVDDQIKSLRVKLLWIQSFLKDAEERHRDNERIKTWVGLMRDIAYDAEDVIDLYILRIELQRQKHCCSFAKCVGSINKLPTLHKLGKEVANINARFQEIVACKSHFGVDEIPTGGPSIRHPRERHLRRSSPQEVVDAVGLEDAVRSLTRQLTDQDVPRRAVISIVGMGGSGKTTLASRVYNSTDVTDHFKTKAWISVSQNFREKDLLQGIAEAFTEMTRKEMGDVSVQVLVQRISDYLTDKKYLLVVDDIWSGEAWNHIKHALPNNQNGSRVMLTTRIRAVAAVADPDIHPYEMKPLEKDQSWELFRKKAFPDASCPKDLETMGKEIVEQCCDLPLAVIIMGGLLRGKDQSSIQWRKVLQRITMQFGDKEDQVRRILGLSYDDLPHHLKSCFIYLSMFSEDSEIDASRLIRMWIAEGFIPDEQEMTLEEVAEEYLDDLIDRSMVQLKSRNDYGGLEKVRIHDLLLDLALSEAREINFLSIYNRRAYSTRPSNSRRLVVHSHTQEYSFLNLSAPKLRSFMYTGPRPTLDQNLSCCARLRTAAKDLVVGLLPCIPKLVQFPCHGSKFLRVINLRGLGPKGLPKEIGNMIQVRYLGLEDTKLHKLPSSIGNLCNLQTLDIRRTFIKSLPKAFWRIQTLRHVFLNHEYFTGEPKVISELDNLQMLEGVKCGHWVRKGLVRMRNLRCLSMTGVSLVDVDALAVALKRLDYLVSLALRGEYLPVKVFTFSTHQHLQELELHGPLGQCLPAEQPLLPNLRRLRFHDTKLEKNDIIILAKLPELHFLLLSGEACTGRELEFPGQGFPKLEELLLNDLRKLEQLEVGKGGLAHVRTIVMGVCRNLRMLPKGMQCMTSLVTLKLFGMPTIVHRIRQDGGEDYNKIRHVQSIIIHGKNPITAESLPPNRRERAIDDLTYSSFGLPYQLQKSSEIM